MNLVERLRADHLPGDRQRHREARIELYLLRHEAADRIAEVEAQLAKAREGLEKIGTVEYFIAGDYDQALALATKRREIARETLAIMGTIQMPNLDELRAVAQRVRKEGENRKSDAGYSGRMDDGGGGRLIEAADAFLAGLERRIPPGWEPYLDEIHKESDPEWQEYQRLRQKFRDG